MMKAKWMILLAGGVVLTMILLTGHQPVIAAPPAGEVKTVGSVIGIEAPPVPKLQTSFSNDWMQLLYDPLMGQSPEGKLSPDFGLAQKWEMSSDGLTWTFYLRKGVKFHDGVELTAKDVKFSIEQLLLPDATVGEALFFKRDVKSIEAKDPYTVVVHCKQPNIFLPILASGIPGLIIPKDYYERVGKDEFAKRPIGSGPYKWNSQVVGSSIKLEATGDKHWRDGGVPRYKYMTYLIIPEESTRIAMLRTEEADIARISRGAVKEALSAGLNLISKENGGVLVFHPNMQWTSPVFSDIRFRKALNLAIDKESIIKNLFSGLAKPLPGFPGSSKMAFGGDPTLKPYPYDPQEARRLIKEGGWEGHEFTLLSYPRSGCPEFALVIEAMAGYWQKIGLKPNIRISEWAVWRVTMRERKTQNTVCGYDDLVDPDIASLLIKFDEKWDFEQALSTVNIPELNERFKRIKKSMDVAEISKLMAEIYRYAYDHYLMIPICEFPDKIATTKKIPEWNPGIRRNDRNYFDLIRQR